MANRNITDRIQRFNLSQARDPYLLSKKYEAMRSPDENPFVFFRATCHLFYEDLPIKSWFKKAPLVWICGDLHIENFGNYKADNRSVYFDINDFDEAILAPTTWEIARLLTSIFVATQTFAIGEIAENLCHQLLESYGRTIAEGKAYWMGEDTAPEVIEDLLSRKHHVKRKALLEERTILDNEKQKRSLKIDNKKALSVSESQKQKVQAFMEDFATRHPNPQFFKLLDVAQRIAGKGSLGIERYVLLVEGKGSPDNNYLLDLKKALPSSLMPYSIWKQPHWQSEADRIVSIQKRSQAIPIAFLQAVTMGADSFVLRELQSTQSPTDSLKIEKWDDQLMRSEQLMQALGKVVAWSHIRSSGRQDSATVEQLMEFASKSKWRTEVMEYAKSYSQQVYQDWKEFCK
ncbi:DUF2252 family protein [Pseudanabaena sp. FACHB-1998]|uniref:DUF2252 domain-containing protein n=1 Tax=Pseudanabaena sp. FACHB-1998 TaxID=2692858 RepID=UPI0016808474|nr:DUF2252 family protein [Pseudanabaena sp. FACHB-1998]MBD2177299.1 DUF2252 family protein [Pseudanabaena sp. FACHB-1998]